jgi:hypothetical protein
MTVPVVGPQPGGPEPGWTTTEFWVTAITVVLSVVGVLHPGFHLPVSVQDASALCAAVAVAAYAIARGIRKHGQ